jgi:hypothetical protein
MYILFIIPIYIYLWFYLTASASLHLGPAPVSRGEFEWVKALFVNFLLLGQGESHKVGRGWIKRDYPLTVLTLIHPARLWF